MATLCHSTNVVRFPTRRRKAFRIPEGINLGQVDQTNVTPLTFARQKTPEANSQILDRMEAGYAADISAASDECELREANRRMATFREFMGDQRYMRLVHASTAKMDEILQGSAA